MNPEKDFSARYRTVLARNGMVSSAHPLGSLAGVAVLQRGGTAMDAAVAMAAVHSVVNPAMIGIGGDVLLLYSSAREGRVVGLNASGRAAAAATVAEYRARGLNAPPITGPLAVTVPGALDGWARALERFGTMPLGGLMEPAIRYAEEGFPADATLVGFYQQVGARVLAQYPDAAATYLINGRAPRPGEVLTQKNLARTFRAIAREGPEIFYHGALGRRVVEALEALGGLITRRDLAEHTSEWVEPITADYRGYTVCEFPPNSQGVALLQQLNILEGFDLAGMEPDAPLRIHLQVEAARLALASLEAAVTDPDRARIPLEEMLDKATAKRLRERINPERAAAGLAPACATGENTACLVAVDRQGNVACFMGSLRNPFGSGVVAGDTGILLHNRGRDFSLDPADVNRLEPRKRPRHTLNPVILLKDGRPHMAIGCVGGHQQTLALQQVLVSHVDDGREIQEAIEAPRWALAEGGTLHVEAALDGAIPGLEARGHRVAAGKAFFGACHAVMIDRAHGTLVGGADPRVTGAALGF